MFNEDVFLHFFFVRFAHNFGTPDAYKSHCVTGSFLEFGVVKSMKFYIFSRFG